MSPLKNYSRKTQLNNNLYLTQKWWLYAIFRTIDFFLTLLPKKKPLLKEPKSILLCNGAHMGDLIILTAVLPQIKKAYPKAKMGMLVGNWAKIVVENHPLVDRIHIVDHWRFNRATIPFWRKFVQYLRTRKQALCEIKKYDLAIDFYFYFPNSILLLWQSGIPIRMGYTTAGFGPLLTHPSRWEEKNQQVVEYHKTLLKELFDVPANLKPCLTAEKTELNLGKHTPRDSKIGEFANLGASDLKPPKKAISEGNIADAEGFKDEAVRAGKTPSFGLRGVYIIFHMGTGAQHKEWPQEKWKKLYSMCRDYKIVFTGKGEREKELATSIAQNDPIFCDSSWNEFLQLIKQARLVVGVDSIAGHIASAFNTPAVLIYSQTTNVHNWKPMHERAEIVTRSVPCGPCYLSKGCEKMTCVRGVEAEEVFEKIKLFL